MISKKSIRSLLLLASCFLLLHCGQEILYNQLAQEDANKVMVLLQQHGIKAKLEQQVIQNEMFWRVKVSQEDIARARQLVVASQVISPKAPGLKEIYEGKGSGGWIKTPAEERARYLLALKGELVNSIKKLPNVVDADVVLNIPQKDDFGLKVVPHPTASVVIKAQPPIEGETALNEVQVQQFVANAVEGMSPRDVSVLLHMMAPLGKELKPGETILLPKGPFPSKGDKSLAIEAEGQAQLMGLKLNPASKERLKIYLMIFFVILILLSAALVFSILQMSRAREELRALKGVPVQALKGGGAEAPQLEAPREEEEEEKG